MPVLRDRLDNAPTYRIIMLDIDFLSRKELTMLRFPEELMLLILDDENGRFARVPDQSLRYALAGGVLMDLAMENRIDTDPERLVLVDSTPVQDSLLDPTLADISQTDETHDARFWVERTAIRSAAGIREASLDRAG